MLDRLNCAALGFFDTSDSPRFVRGQLTRRHCPSYCPERVSHISRRLDCRQMNTTGRPLRSGTSRSTQRRMAVESPPFAAAITALTDVVPIIFEAPTSAAE